MARDWLVKLRNTVDMTHDEIANAIGVSRQYYGMIEAGVRNPSVDLAKRIAVELRFDWTIFFKDLGNEMFLCEQSTTSERKDVG